MARSALIERAPASARLIPRIRLARPSMQTKAYLILFALVASALAGCADSSDTTPTPGATTPAATPAATPTAAMTPTPPDGDGPPAVDPRCLAPPADAPAPTTGTRLGMPELSFTTSDPTDADPCFRFLGPQNATSGWNVFSLTYPQGGQTFHIMPMYHIGDRTIADVMAAFESGSGESPEWSVASGAVGGVTPGQTGRVAVDLQPGNYVYFCPIEGHMFQGMMGILSVTQAQNESAPPLAQATVALTDYNFTLPEIHEDMTVIKVVNNGTEDHEMPLVKLDPGANMTIFLAAVESPTPTGPPPGALVGGVNAIAPGHTVYLLLELAADTTYGSVCFVPSPAHDGMPHIAIGPMVTEFEVKHAGQAH